MTWIVRIPLTLSSIDELAVGGWKAVSPSTFFTHFPTDEASPVTTAAHA
ncbi:hypothetical protein ACFS27_26425 [Promicromonospora vindobonensis]|uniref:Uncharacterized protein n=1 Tax=Promicromonospora vindobonensis TaxID=195748 RepID=A0ABW5W1R1_9MICO